MKRSWIAVVLLLAGCAAIFILQRQKATVPITPRPLLYLVADTQREAERIPLAVTRVSDKRETQVGEQIVGSYGLTAAPAGDPDARAIIEYLNAVGLRVASHVQRKAIPYHFYLQDDPNFVNAFALPGGNIVVGRGLLSLMESEDELAAVLGHEIAHVDNRDAIERLQYKLASEKLGLGDLFRFGAPAVEIFEAGYTKEQEFQADRTGLALAVEAGYSRSLNRTTPSTRTLQSVNSRKCRSVLWLNISVPTRPRRKGGKCCSARSRRMAGALRSRSGHLQFVPSSCATPRKILTSWAISKMPSRSSKLPWRSIRATRERTATWRAPCGVQATPLEPRRPRAT
jgi:predicted Zn-dependent protease